MEHSYKPLGHTSIVHVQDDDLAIPTRLDDQFMPRLGILVGGLAAVSADA